MLTFVSGARFHYDFQHTSLLFVSVPLQRQVPRLAVPKTLAIRSAVSLYLGFGTGALTLLVPVLITYCCNCFVFHLFVLLKVFYRLD